MYRKFKPTFKLARKISPDWGVVKPPASVPRELAIQQSETAMLRAVLFLLQNDSMGAAIDRRV
jgi:hypothetical protein